MWELYILSLEGGWYLPNERGRQLAQYFGKFFHKKVCQKIGRKVSIQPVCLGRGLFEGIFLLSGSGL